MIIPKMYKDLSNSFQLFRHPGSSKVSANNQSCHNIYSRTNLGLTCQGTGTAHLLGWRTQRIRTQAWSTHWLPQEHRARSERPVRNILTRYQTEQRCPCLHAISNEREAPGRIPRRATDTQVVRWLQVIDPGGWLCWEFGKGECDCRLRWDQCRDRETLPVW